MTHSEMTHWLPSPDNVPYSPCDGEMVRSDLPDRVRASVDGHRGGARTELWHCERCRYTMHVEVDPRGFRRIRSGYPAPSPPPLRIAPLN